MRNVNGVPSCWDDDVDPVDDWDEYDPVELALMRRRFERRSHPTWVDEG